MTPSLFCLQHAGVPEADLIGLPVGLAVKGAARRPRVLELDDVARKILREAGQRVVVEVAPLPAGDQLT